MLDRRSILSLFGGAGLAAGSGLRVSDVAAVARLHGVGLGPGIGACQDVPPLLPRHDRLRQAFWALRRRRERDIQVQHGSIPPHIAAMKSWSPAYKAHVFGIEEAAMEAFDNRLNTDDGGVIEALARRLFGDD